jgi:hypothetical protein
VPHIALCQSLACAGSPHQQHVVTSCSSNVACSQADTVASAAAAKARLQGSSLAASLPKQCPPHPACAHIGMCPSLLDYVQCALYMCHAGLDVGVRVRAIGCILVGVGHCVAACRGRSLGGRIGSSRGHKLLLHSRKRWRKESVQSVLARMRTASEWATKLKCGATHPACLRACSTSTAAWAVTKCTPPACLPSISLRNTGG